MAENGKNLPDPDSASGPDWTVQQEFFRSRGFKSSSPDTADEYWWVKRGYEVSSPKNCSKGQWDDVLEEIERVEELIREEEPVMEVVRRSSTGVVDPASESTEKKTSR
jgi:hypothetical protein